MFVIRPSANSMNSEWFKKKVSFSTFLAVFFSFYSPLPLRHVLNDIGNEAVLLLL